MIGQQREKIAALEEQLTIKVPETVGSALATYLGYIQSNPLVD